MKYDVSFLNGSNSAVRGKPYTTLLFSCIDEWTEHNVESPEIIRMSPEFHKGLSSEFGGNVGWIVSLVGKHRIQVVNDIGYLELVG